MKCPEKTGGVFSLSVQRKQTAEKKKNILCTTEKNKCPLREEMGAIPMEIEVFFEKKLQFFAGYPCIQNMFCL